MALSQTASKKPLASKVTSATPVKKPLAKKAPTLQVKDSKLAAQTLPKAQALPKALAPPKVKATTAAVRKKSPAKTATRKSALTPEERYKLIQAAAYLRAERRGFASGHALEDWIAAEAEIGNLHP